MNTHYQTRYERFIASRALRSIPDGTYTEVHHILPTSMGGPDIPSNKVVLTGREHFIAHWLLFLAHKTPSMARAYMMMHDTPEGNAKRFLKRHNPRESRHYQGAKQMVANDMSARTKGMTVAKHKVTGEILHVTSEQLKTDPNLEHHMRGSIPVRRLSTGVCSVVSTEDYRSDPDLVPVSTGMNTGEGSYWHRGMFVTPLGKFDSRTKAMVAHGFKSPTSILNRCIVNNKKPLALHAMSICQDIPKEMKAQMVGKCWADFGWGFEPVRGGSSMKPFTGEVGMVNTKIGKSLMKDPVTGEHFWVRKEDATPNLVPANKGRVRKSSGTYITPKGEFRTKQEVMDAFGFKSNTAVDNRCRVLNEQVITARSMQCNHDMTKEEKVAAVGKTWKELGWGFRAE